MEVADQRAEVSLYSWVAPTFNSDTMTNYPRRARSERRFGFTSPFSGPSVARRGRTTTCSRRSTTSRMRLLPVNRA